MEGGGGVIKKFSLSRSTQIKKFKIIKFELRIKFLSELQTPTLLATTLQNKN